MSEMNEKSAVREALEKELYARIHRGEGADKTLWEAMEYSLMAGGKRVRPMLLIHTGRSLGAPMELLMPFACALEMIHSSSLIHDDLPAMDDDDYRRGRLTNHKVFGEAAAILAGDGLLNLAYEIMADTAAKLEEPLDKSRAVHAMAYIAQCAGAKGMMARSRMMCWMWKALLKNSESRWAVTKKARKRPLFRCMVWKRPKRVSGS